MTIKELQRYRYAISEAQAIQQQIEQLYNTVRSPNLVSIGARGNTVSDPTHAALTKIDELREELEEIQRGLAEQAKAIEEWLVTVPDYKSRAVVRWHFLLGKSWKETARRTGELSSEGLRKSFYRWFYDNEKGEENGD